ncbi:exported hypothetical protein [Rubrivivax sp. A210]|uniref:hypothetical protein n=1 Tax=Rubrivivax sp. A210 TaxID=2772301 RepID=UPI00191A1F7E|nr:hypothetical protein [Rubrivivax sp. A210]CAD5372331.1 exported hypothetical protein [Rubrivivax sp. A210]
MSSNTGTPNMKRSHPVAAAAAAALVFSLPLHAGAQDAGAASGGTTVAGVAAKVGGAIERGAKAAASGIERGARAAERGVRVGLEAAARGIERGAQATARAAGSVAGKVESAPAARPDSSS